VGCTIVPQMLPNGAILHKNGASHPNIIGEPSLHHEQISANGSAKVSVKVTNTGTRAGDQVVQMYVHHSVSSVVQPVIALRGFKRVHLEAGAFAIVSFEVGPDQLSILDAQMKKTVEPGPVEVRIGSSSAETSSVRLTIIE
jgi:beta-glucosidase